MKRIPSLRSTRLPDVIRALPLLGAVFVFLLAPQLAQAAYSLKPLGSPETIPVGKAGKAYLVVSNQPVQIPIIGPGKLTGYARVAFAPGETDAKSGVLTLGGIAGIPGTLPFEFKTSARAVYGDARPGTPSGGRKITVSIPDGVFTLSVHGEATDGSPVFTILYYDGPSQPAVPGLAREEDESPRKSPWSFRKKFGLQFMYDDNITTVSDEDLIEFQSGINASGELSDPNKFMLKTYDDFIVSPSLDVEARRKFFSCGQTRFRVKVQPYLYTTNHIKHNYDSHYYLRQYVGKGKSLEAYYGYAPEQYIRQLGSDGDPFLDEDWSRKEFRFTRNVANITYRQTINKKLSVKVLYEINKRYYNLGFVENDIDAWEVRGNLAWKAHKALRFNFDYSYEDGPSRARNQTTETRLNADESDPSYKRDLYRAGVSWKPKFLKKLVSSIDFAFLFMDYYYTSERYDNFNFGRHDKIYKGTLSVGRKLSKKVSMTAAARYTERTVESPGASLTVDKPFDQRRYWIAFNISL